MTRLGDIASKVRSKNAGPFWLTIDIFCGTPEVFAQVSRGLDNAALARLFKTSPDKLKRFEIESLCAIKVSLPRPAVQGTAADRDMHGASFAQIVSEIEI